MPRRATAQPARRGPRGRARAARPARGPAAAARGQRRRVARRAAGASARGGGSDLFARVLVAVPAAVVAIVFIDLGGLAFALFMIALGWLCMHELYRHAARAGDPVRAGRASSRWPGCCSPRATAASARCCSRSRSRRCRSLFLLDARRGRSGRASVAIAGTLLGIYWIGFAFAHAVLLRGLPARQRRS